MKKTLAIITVALFLLVCLIPSLGMLVLGESGPAANEILAAAPKLTTRSGDFNAEVLSDTAAYIADRFALRQELVTAWSRLNAGLLRSSAEEQVVLGREGWLYYSSTLDDYTGQALSDAQLRRIAQNLAAIQAYVEARGARFLFTVAPNKNSLYPQYMPARFEARHETSNVAALQSHLQEAGVHYVDLYAALADGPVRYYRTDSHWTAQGAAIAADRLLAAAGVASDYVEGPFAVDGTRRGDLYEMLYPAAAGAENEVLYAGMLGYETRSDPNDGNAITIETDRDGAQGGLLCWRDSFGVALYPYLADSFGHAVFSRAAVYDFTKYDPQEYDVVLIEIVERNLPRLAEDCAVFSTD